MLKKVIAAVIRHGFLDRDGVGIKRYEIYSKYLPNDTYPSAV